MVFQIYTNLTNAHLVIFILAFEIPVPEITDNYLASENASDEDIDMFTVKLKASQVDEQSRGNNSSHLRQDRIWDEDRDRWLSPSPQSRMQTSNSEVRLECARE